VVWVANDDSGNPAQHPASNGGAESAAGLGEQAGFGPVNVAALGGGLQWSFDLDLAAALASAGLPADSGTAEDQDEILAEQIEAMERAESAAQPGDRPGGDGPACSAPGSGGDAGAGPGAGGEAGAGPGGAKLDRDGPQRDGPDDRGPDGDGSASGGSASGGSASGGSASGGPASGGPARGRDGMRDLSGLVAEHLPTGPGLAAWLSQRSPEVLSDWDLPGAAAAFRKVASWAQAAELAVVAQIASRSAVRDDQVEVTDDGRPERVTRDAAAQVSFALALSPFGAESWTGLAVTLRWRLPATAAALAAGEIDLYRAKIIAEAVMVLPDEVAKAVEKSVLPHAGNLTYGQLHSAVRRAVIAADPEGAEQRREAAERQARVTLYPDQDNTAALGGSRLPAVHAAAAMARISAMARALKAAGAGGGMDLLRAQVFLGLLLGTLPLIPPPADGPPDTDPSPADGLPPDDNLPPDDGHPPDDGQSQQGGPAPRDFPRPDNGGAPSNGRQGGRRRHGGGAGAATGPASRGRPHSAAPNPDEPSPDEPSPDRPASDDPITDDPGAGASHADDPGGGSAGPAGRGGFDSGGHRGGTDGAGQSGAGPPGTRREDRYRNGGAAGPAPPGADPRLCTGASAGTGADPPGDGGRWPEWLVPSDADAPEDDGYREPPVEPRVDEFRPDGDPLDDERLRGDIVRPWPAVPVTSALPSSGNGASGPGPASAGSTPDGSVARGPSAGEPGRPAGECGRPAPGLLDLTVSLATLTHESPSPGRLGRIGPITAVQTRQLARLAARDRTVEWRVIVTDQDRHAIAVTRLPRPRLPAGLAPPGTSLTGRVTVIVPATAVPGDAGAPLGSTAGRGGNRTSLRSSRDRDLRGRADGWDADRAEGEGGRSSDCGMGEGGRGADCGMGEDARSSDCSGGQSGAMGPVLSAILRAAARARDHAAELAAADEGAPGGCAHIAASPAYRPPPRVREHVIARDLTCRQPYCGQPAWRGDLDHTVPYEQGGPTCSCNLGPVCRGHHRLKQLAGWTLSQPRPGMFTWTTPAGRAYTTGPDAQLS
jgi:hypothetical protein